MRQAAIVTLLIASGCSSTTSLRLNITGDAADATAAPLTLSLFDAHHALLRAQSLGDKALPLVAVAYALPATAEPLRIVVARAGNPRQLGSATVALSPRHEARVAVALAATTPDGDGDGVPDAVDNCPGVPNPDQASASGSGGDACSGHDLGGSDGGDMIAPAPGDMSGDAGSGRDGGPGADLMPPPVPSLSLLAGALGGHGDADGVGGDARLSNPNGVAIAGSKVYVIEATGALRVVDPAARTVATVKLVDGISGQDISGFASPSGVVYDGNGNLYLTELWGHDVRRVRIADGAVFNVAGTNGTSGYKDGAAASALFNQPNGIALDGSGKLWVADSANTMVRVITLGAAPTVSTAAGATGSTTSVDGSGGTGGSARFANPYAIVVRGGKVFVGDGSSVRVIDTTQAATASTYVGTAVLPNIIGGVTGLAVGPGTSDLLASDNDYVVRDVIPGAPPSFAVVAGMQGTSWSSDGSGSGAGFRWPANLTGDGNGTWYISDDAALRRFDWSTKQVSTIVGKASQGGYSDDPPSLLTRPYQIVFDGKDTVYFADNGNSRVRAYQLSTGTTRLVAGSGLDQTTDGTGKDASFGAPAGLALDGSGNLWVSDLDTNAIRKISLADGKVTTVVAASAGGAPPLLHSPQDVAFDGNRTIFVADMQNCVIRAIDTMTNTLSIFAGTGAGDEIDNPAASAAFDWPIGLAVDRARHILYVADWAGHTVRSIDLVAANHPVSTLAGQPGTNGSMTGPFGKARFNNPRALAYDDAAHVLYLSDAQNHIVRALALDTKMVSSYVGDGTQTTMLGPLPARINQPAGLAVTPRGLVIATSQENALLLAH